LLERAPCSGHFLLQSSSDVIVQCQRWFHSQMLKVCVVAVRETLLRFWLNPLEEVCRHFYKTCATAREYC
jgi:hypothetical protein